MSPAPTKTSIASQVMASPLAQGQQQLLAVLAGRKIGYKGMCLAKCYECMGYYSDGKQDCGVDYCPLYPMMPYRAKGVK